ncbi:unnamed protein product [Merluccius merluccius]
MKNRGAFVSCFHQRDGLNSVYTPLESGNSRHIRSTTEAGITTLTLLPEQSVCVCLLTETIPNEGTALDDS